MAPPTMVVEADVACELHAQLQPLPELIDEPLRTRAWPPNAHVCMTACGVAARGHGKRAPSAHSAPRTCVMGTHVGLPPSPSMKQKPVMSVLSGRLLVQ